ncbi:MAG: histidine--tRNA ligase [Candidatus Pacebacteria bacterium]|nr:histidine--tRNA ligase [Candidatus Paceibacterota bacterium]
MAKNNYQAPTGMHDLFQGELDQMARIEQMAKRVADFYGFEKIATPILEFSEIFEKGTGAFTDIVEKEMYTFKTKGGDILTLRPEITPGVVRAYNQHGMQNLPKPVRFWYLGPCFRHERPQAGRYRQFNQLGFESLGAEHPIIDAITILVFYSLLKSLGFKKLAVQINCIGDSQCRGGFKKALSSYLRSKTSSLCVQCRVRQKKNPLRVLDCKEEKCEAIKKNAPQILDHLCKDCSDHFKGLLEFLEELEIPYNVNPYLVRGLDYYTRTVFEISEDTEDGKAQGSLAGGGRYDGLVKLLGGKDTPACGGAMGIERVINLIKARTKEQPPKEPTCEVYLTQVGELAKRKALKLFEQLRQANIKVAEGLHKESLSAQLKQADKMKVKYSIIIGQKEALDKQVIIREMKNGRQKIVDMDKVVRELKGKI